MNLTLAFLYLHIVLIFLGVTFSVGGGILMRLAFMTGQVAPLRGVGMVFAHVGPLVPILFVTGGLFGLLTAISLGTNLVTPWLVIAYVLFAINLVIGGADSAPRYRKLGGLAAKTPDGPITPEIAALFTAPRVIALTAIEYAVLLLVVFDMVFKPFS